MIQTFFAVTAMILLVGCTSSPVYNAEPLPQLTYDHLKPISVNTAQINIQRDIHPGAKVWNLTDEMATPPVMAVQRYLQKRFQATGRDGVLNMTLKKADIQLDRIPHENRLLAFIPFADRDDYTMEIIVDLESLYNSGQPDRKTSVRFIRKVSIPQDATLAYREAKVQRTLEEMIRDMDNGMLSTLAGELGLVHRDAVNTTPIDVKTDVPAVQTGLGEIFKGKNDAHSSSQPLNQ